MAKGSLHNYYLLTCTFHIYKWQLWIRQILKWSAAYHFTINKKSTTWHTILLIICFWWHQGRDISTYSFCLQKSTLFLLKTLSFLSFLQYSRLFRTRGIIRNYICMRRWIKWTEPSERHSQDNQLLSTSNYWATDLFHSQGLVLGTRRFSFSYTTKWRQMGR